LWCRLRFILHRRNSGFISFLCFSFSGQYPCHHEVLQCIAGQYIKSCPYEPGFQKVYSYFLSSNYNTRRHVVFKKHHIDQHLFHDIVGFFLSDIKNALLGCSSTTSSAQLTVHCLRALARLFKTEPTETICIVLCFGYTVHLRSSHLIQSFNG
jgi:hypothetical protein